MRSKKAIIAVVVVVLLLVAGGIGIAMLQLTKNTGVDDTAVQDAPASSDNLKEQHWDAENQISQVGQKDEPESSEVTTTIEDEASQFTPMERTTSSLKSRYDEYMANPDASSQPDPRNASVVQGNVGYDDIPQAATVDGGYDADYIRTRIVRYLEENYPTEVIVDIELMGNGSVPSQNTGVATSYANYLVTLSKGQRIGLSVMCSTERTPSVSETNYLVINPGLLYNVQEDEYIPMTVTGQ